MDDASQSPNDEPQDHPGQAIDPLAEVVKRCAAAFQALRTHASLLVDEGICRFYGFLVTAALVLIVLSVIALMMTMGCYYVVSGIAIGMARLFGSEWIGHTCAGAIFLIGPALIGYSYATAWQRARERRIAATYNHIQEQARAP